MLKNTFQDEYFEAYNNKELKRKSSIGALYGCDDREVEKSIKVERRIRVIKMFKRLP